MIQVQGRDILINGEPSFLLSGEIHYFRLPRSEWHDRIRTAKEAGVHVIASYIPWLIHQEAEDELDLDGHLLPENDLLAFIDLCQEEDLWFLARPGPFVMAEIKNEGIPFWVYEKAPDCVPVTWHGRPITSRTLDYLHPDFLGLAGEWYDSVIPLLASRQPSRGGRLLGVQLDNEVGMLSWVRNEPDLTPEIVAELGAQEGAEGIDWRNPSEEDSLRWRGVYANWQRRRISRYFSFLKDRAEKNGLSEVPFFLNIHGTGGGRAATFPVGLQQLQDAMQIPGIVSGTDHYLGEITRENFPDLWYMDAFTRASNPGPLTSLEFEVGNGDYGDCEARRVSGESAAMKALLGAVKGNRLINAYLIAGGFNRPLRHPVGDGNDRVAFTGERHGFAAPITPEGAKGSTYPSLQRTFRTLHEARGVLAGAREELDDISLAYIPDAYATEYRLPGPLTDLCRSLEGARTALENMLRGILLSGFRPGALNLQEPLPEALPAVIAVPVCPHMSPEVQGRLIEAAERGSALLLAGDMPAFDLLGRPCTLLMDFLGTKPGSKIEASDGFHLSGAAVGPLAGPAEFRMGWARPLTAAGPADPWVALAHSGETSAVHIRGPVHAFIVSCDLPSHPRLWGPILSKALGVKARLDLRASDSGVVGSWCQNEKSESALVVINLDMEPKKVHPHTDGAAFTEEPILIGPREAKLILRGKTKAPAV